MDAYGLPFYQALGDLAHYLSHEPLAKAQGLAPGRVPMQ